MQVKPLPRGPRKTGSGSRSTGDETSPWASPVPATTCKLNFFVGLCIHRKKHTSLAAMNVIGRLILLAGLVMTSTAYALESKLTYPQLLGGSIALILIVFVLFSDDLPSPYRVGDC